MDKLKNKVFYTIFLILTISILSFIFIFNSRNYIQEKNNIIHSLEVASNNNKKSVKETFVNKDKVLIYILGMIILTSSLTYISGLITNNYFLNNNKIII